MSELEGFAKLEVARKTGQEPFHRNGEPLASNLLGFWRWSASDLVSNATRGILAEYIVACALGVNDGVRTEWDAYDLRTKSGVRIEVKSAGYLQSWFHQKLSKISFGIRPTRSWDAATNSLQDQIERQGDIYVFCLLHHQDKATLDPLNFGQWTFYIVSANTLNEKFPIQKTIGLSSLLKLKPLQAKYENIANCIQSLTA